MHLIEMHHWRKTLFFEDLDSHLGMSTEDDSSTDELLVEGQHVMERYNKIALEIFAQTVNPSRNISYKKTIAIV